MDRRIIAVVSGFAVLLFVAVFSYREALSDVVSDLSLYSAYRNGVAFYRDHPEENAGANDRWLASLLFEYRHAVVSGDVESQWPDPFLIVLGERKRALSVFESLDPIRTEGGGYDYRLRKEYRGFLVDPWDSMLLRALYCPVYGYSDRDFSALASVPLDGAYSDTRKLLALLFLREKGCYDRDVLDRLIRQGAEHLARSVERDMEWSDLFSERIVLLYWAGEGSLVKREWIDRIVSAQGGDGGFVDPKLSDGPNGHSTGLSMLAIRYFLEGRSEVPFLAPLDRTR